MITKAGRRGMPYPSQHIGLEKHFPEGDRDVYLTVQQNGERIGMNSKGELFAMKDTATSRPVTQKDFHVLQEGVQPGSPEDQFLHRHRSNNVEG